MARVPSDERRAQIVAAAGDIVRRQGFGATRLADVGRSLGLSAPLIVYHFGTKDALMAAVLAAEAEAELDRLERIVAAELTPEQKLDRIVALALGAASRPDWALWIDAWGEALRSEVMRRHLVELDRRWWRLMRAVVDEGQTSGAFRRGGTDAGQVADRIMALLDGYGVQLARAEPGSGGRRGSSVLRRARRAIGVELGFEPRIEPGRRATRATR